MVILNGCVWVSLRGQSRLTAPAFCSISSCEALKKDCLHEVQRGFIVIDLLEERERKSDCNVSKKWARSALGVRSTPKALRFPLLIEKLQQILVIKTQLPMHSLWTGPSSGPEQFFL
jgi:hypothetical protein